MNLRRISTILMVSGWIAMHATLAGGWTGLTMPENPNPSLGQRIYQHLTQVLQRAITDVPAVENLRTTQPKHTEILATAKDGKTPDSIFQVRRQAIHELITTGLETSASTHIERQIEVLQRMSQGVKWELDLTKPFRSDPPRQPIRYGLVLKNIEPDWSGSGFASMYATELDALNSGGSAQVTWSIGPITELDGPAFNHTAPIYSAETQTPWDQHPSYRLKHPWARSLPSPKVRGDIKPLRLQGAESYGYTARLYQVNGLYQYILRQSGSTQSHEHHFNLPLSDHLGAGFLYGNDLEELRRSLSLKHDALTLTLAYDLAPDVYTAEWRRSLGDWNLIWTQQAHQLEPDEMTTITSLSHAITLERIL